MNTRMAEFYMNLANECSKMSRAVRLQVGCVIVKDNNIISFSWNGTPKGWNNNCEDKEYIDQGAGGWLNPDEIAAQWPYEEDFTDEDGIVIQRRYRLKTKPEVLHAERNALDKLARGHEGGLGASLFVTHSPCLECAKSIYGAGIKEVLYKTAYRSDNGIKFLKECNIIVKKIDE